MDDGAGIWRSEMGLDDVIGDVWPSRVRRGWSRHRKGRQGELVTLTREREHCLGEEEEITIHDCICGWRDTAERGGERVAAAAASGRGKNVGGVSGRHSPTGELAFPLVIVINMSFPFHFPFFSAPNSIQRPS